VGNGQRFRRTFLKPFRQNPTERASIRGVQKGSWTDESSAETLDTKRIHLDVTDPGSEIKEREAAKPSCPKPPEPKNGRRPIVKMILQWNEKERIKRAILDWGVSIPVLSKQWALKNQVPIFQREKRRIIENFAGITHADIRLTYSYPLRLQHRKHFLVESCEIIIKTWSAS
jgi:hypothetical protein